MYEQFPDSIKDEKDLDIYENISKFDLIFNTIPKLIIDADMLSKIGKRTLVIDLASVPGGVDFEAARKMGVKVIWALSLPGKVAPDTAGDIIAQESITHKTKIKLKNLFLISYSFLC